jgi:hypothetical protein
MVTVFNHLQSFWHWAFERSRLETLALVTQIAGLPLLLVSAVFVYQQVQDANRTAARNEATSMHSRWAELRSSIYSNPDTAALFDARGERYPPD